MSGVRKQRSDFQHAKRVAAFIMPKINNDLLPVMGRIAGIKHFLLNISAKPDEGNVEALVAQPFGSIYAFHISDAANAVRRWMLSSAKLCRAFQVRPQG